MMSFMMVLLILATLLAAVSLFADVRADIGHEVFVSDTPIQRVYVIKENGEFKVVDEVLETQQYLAKAAFRDDIENPSVGAASLWVETAKSTVDSDEALAYAAGMAEGYITALRIKQYANNNNPVLESGSRFDPKLADYSQKQESWMQHMVSYHKGEDPWWAMVGLMLQQLRGMADGYALTDYDKLDYLDFYMLNMAGDWEDLAGIFYPEVEVSALKKYWETHLHCSAGVRLDVANNDVYFAQDTWNVYISMTRIMKSYNFHFSMINAEHVVFSSYASNLVSLDDLYVTSQKLAIYETTYSIPNTWLYDYGVNPQTVPTWIRSMVSNRLAIDGPSWGSSFARENSGTYNNQWTIVNYKLLPTGDFKNAKLPPYLATTLEVAPAFHRLFDSTPELERNGYLLGINSPSEPYVYAFTGYPLWDDDPYWSYKESSRYQIFARDMPNVASYEDFQAFMRSNKYKTDPLCNGDPGQCICSRYDLRVDVPGHEANDFGGLDSKTTRRELVEQMRFDVISRPTIPEGCEDENDCRPWSFPEAPEGLLKDWGTMMWFVFDGLADVWEA